jgi:excinuclease UvrABC ATPase subunit
LLRNSPSFEGGYVVAAGTPEAVRPALGLDPRVAASPQSYTGHYLKQVLKRRSGATRKRAAEAAE